MLLLRAMTLGLLLPYHQGRKQSIGFKWLYKTKYNPDGSVERYKSRLVILGLWQIYGLDYAETFAPVAKMTTVRALLAVAAMQGWLTIKMDVTNPFLHGDLDEVVYMKFPQGYTGLGSRVSVNQGEPTPHTHTSSTVCRLNKSLYGLKQAPRQWFSKLSTTLHAVYELHSIQSRLTIYSLFTKINAGNILLILIYVDDLLICGNCALDIQHLKSMLSTKFHMKDSGELRSFLGLEIDRSSNGIFVSQKKYTIDLLKAFGMLHVTPLKLPTGSHLKLTPHKALARSSHLSEVTRQVNLSHSY